MNGLNFENIYYEEALEYSQIFSRTKEDGYYKIDLPRKADQIQIQENNTIIALLTSLHHRITQLENRVFKIEHILIGANQLKDWNQTIDNLNKDLSKLSTRGIVRRRLPPSYSFLIYQQAQPNAK